MSNEVNCLSLKFAIMITTRNRCEDLKRTLAVLEYLESMIDIIVCADGCTDGTEAMVREMFPTVNLMVNRVSVGSVEARIKMLNKTQADWVLSLDDDSYPLDKNFFERAECLIHFYPNVSVFTFPELRDEGVYSSHLMTPQSPGIEVPAYPNCAALMRRDDYFNTQGYPYFFFHTYEEPDYALQVYAMGKKVWFEPSLTIRHHRSSMNRSNLKNHHFNARNELWSVWLRCPLPWLFLVSLFRVIRQFQHACSQGLDWTVKEPLWWLSAFRGLPLCIKHRKPIAWIVYYQWMRLAKK